MSQTFWIIRLSVLIWLFILLLCPFFVLVRKRVGWSPVCIRLLRMTHLIEFRCEVIASSSVHANCHVRRGLCSILFNCRTTEDLRFGIGKFHICATWKAFTLNFVVDRSLDAAVVFVGLHLIGVCDVLSHTTFASFHDCLCLLDISSTRLSRSFLQAIVWYHLVVSILFDSFSLIADFLTFSDDA